MLGVPGKLGLQSEETLIQKPNPNHQSTAQESKAEGGKMKTIYVNQCGARSWGGKNRDMENSPTDHEVQQQGGLAR